MHVVYGGGPVAAVIQTGVGSGTLSQSIGEFTLSSAGQLAIQGTLSKSIGDFTLSSAGQLAIQGALSQSIGDFTLSSEGTSVVGGIGILSKSIGDFTLSSAGQLAIQAAFSNSIGNFTLSSTGLVSTSGVLFVVHEFTSSAGASSVQYRTRNAVTQSLVQDWTATGVIEDVRGDGKSSYYVYAAISTDVIVQWRYSSDGVTWSKYASDDYRYAESDIKAKTDSLTFTQAGMVDANIQMINDVSIIGNGSTTPYNV